MRDQPERDTDLIFETAAHHATARVPIAAPGQRMNQIREQLMGQRYESASHVVVCDADMFRGVVTIENVLSAPGDMPIESLAAGPCRRTRRGRSRGRVRNPAP
jgi:hypothetical protein